MRTSLPRLFWRKFEWAAALLVHAFRHLSNIPENWLGFLKAASKRKHWDPVNIVRRDQNKYSCVWFFASSKYCRHRKCYSFDQELRCVTTLISWLSFWQLCLFKRTLCHVSHHAICYLFKKLNLFSHLLNFKTNDPVLLLKTI